MRKPPEEFRRKRLVVRVTEEEDRLLAARAAMAEINKTDYVRTRALDMGLAPRHARAPSVDRQELCRGLGILAEAGQDLRDILAEVRVGDTPLVGKVDYVLGKVIEASEAVIRSLAVAR